MQGELREWSWLGGGWVSRRCKSAAPVPVAGLIYSGGEPSLGSQQESSKGKAFGND